MSLPRTLVRAAKDKVWRALLVQRRMRFPTFSAALHDEIAGRRDYARHAALALALSRLDAEGIQGAIAEVGVFKGETSGVLRAASLSRTLYLFDTFDGFPEADLEAFQRGDARFENTSIEVVRSNVVNTDRVVFRPGRVPETLAGLEGESFAFVLLDLDLYSPTVSSLEFFYPRLVPGGYLVLHDYNNSESNWAIRRALDEFIADKPEQIVDLPDIWGSVLLRKGWA